MNRKTIEPRHDWQQIVTHQGMHYHSLDDEPYWTEDAYYEFDQAEIDLIEKATYECDKICLAAVQHIIDNDLWDRFLIPESHRDWIAKSWEEDEHTLYGRFDFCFRPGQRPMLLEYNADTPTALLEGSVIQWFWLKDVFPHANQFNSIHERLLEIFQTLRKEIGDERFYFAAQKGNVEDYMTVQYLRDIAVQAGFGPINGAEYLHIEDIGWHEGAGIFTDLQEREIKHIFKLYPWEWMMREQFATHLLKSRTKWWEPPWKALLSNKALLPLLWELNPNHEFLLKAFHTPEEAEVHDCKCYVKKPILSREGANVAIVEYGKTVLETEGPYGDGPAIYQELWELPNFDGKFPVIGSWIVNGWACGMGIREGDGLVTTNTSRFIPHLFGSRHKFGG
jgi:glutathionylspermidine synthase